MNTNDNIAQEHGRLWMKEMTRILMASDKSTAEVNRLIQHYAAQLKENS